MESDHHSTWHGINFIMALIAIIIIIILLIVVYDHRSDVEQYALGWRIVNGTTTGSTDSFFANTNTLYIGESDKDLTLTLEKGSDFIGGVVGVKNNTTNKNITVVAGKGITFQENQIPLVTPGVFSEWLLTSTGYLRLDNPIVEIGVITPPEAPLTSGSNVSNVSSGVQNPLTNAILS